MTRHSPALSIPQCALAPSTRPPPNRAPSAPLQSSLLLPPRGPRVVVVAPGRWAGACVAGHTGYGRSFATVARSFPLCRVSFPLPCLRLYLRTRLLVEEGGADGTLCRREWRRRVPLTDNERLKQMCCLYGCCKESPSVRIVGWEAYLLLLRCPCGTQSVSGVGG